MLILLLVRLIVVIFLFLLPLVGDSLLGNVEDLAGQGVHLHFSDVIMGQERSFIDQVRLCA